MLRSPCVADGILKPKSKLSTEMGNDSKTPDGLGWEVVFHSFTGQARRMGHRLFKSKLSTEMGNDSKTPDCLRWEVVFHSFTGKARKMWHRLFKLLPSHWMCSSCWSTVLHISFVFFFFFGGACWSTPHYLIWKPYSTLYYLTYKPYTVIAHHTI